LIHAVLTLMAEQDKLQDAMDKAGRAATRRYMETGLKKAGFQPAKAAE